MNNIFLQYSLNGDVNSYGKAYIGKQGQSPIDEANALTVYTDVNKINSLSGFAIDLDFDGLPVVDGSRVELYTDEAYTLQLADKRGAYLFIDWLSVNASIGTTETKNWVKTLEPETTNLTVNNDGEGNYTINAASLGGGDVFKGSSNTYDQGTTQAFDDITATAAIVGGKNLDVSSSESNTYAPGTTQAFDAATLKGKNLEELAGNRVSRFFDGSLTSGDNTIYDFSDFDLLDWVDVSITLSAFSSSGQGDPQLIVLCDRLEGDGAVKNSTSSDYSIKQSSTVISTVHDVKIGTSNGTSIFATELTPPVAFLEGQRALLTINTTLQKYHANQIIKITLSSASQAQVKYSLTAKRSQALEI